MAEITDTLESFSCAMKSIKHLNISRNNIWGTCQSVLAVGETHEGGLV